MRQRIPETNEGIQRAPDVADYDRFARTMRDRGWIETDRIIRSGIVFGHALEIGPGPGYLGLEWLKNTDGTRLTGLEISLNMIDAACRNRQEYGLDARAEYILGNAMDMPFPSGSFDAVFSNGSLHEWEAPGKILGEIYRVLKPGGRFFVSDLRRDESLPVRTFLNLSATPAMRAGLNSSLRASYTPEEAKRLLPDIGFKRSEVCANAIGFEILGEK